MAENLELERRIADDPEDLEAYLVYAAWLEGAGDPRGELIGIHHAMIEDPSDDALRRAESSLLFGHPGHFLPERLIRPGSGLLEWRMGFLRAARVDTTQKYLVALLGHPSSRFLEELTCPMISRVDEIIDVLGVHPACATLRSLEIDCSETVKFPLSFWPRFHRLRRLTIGASEGLTRTLRHTRLETLALRASGAVATTALATDAAPAVDVACLADELEPLLDGRALPALRSLTLVGGTGAGLALLIGSVLAQGLQELHFTGGLEDEDADRLLASRRELEHVAIELRRTHLTDEAADALRRAGISVH